MREVLAIIGFVLIAACVVASTILKYTHIDMTETRLAVNYFWPWGVIGVVGCALIAVATIGKDS